MNTIGDIVYNVMLRIVTPMIVSLVSVVSGILSAIVSAQLGAATEPIAGGEETFSLPLIVFAPGRFSVSNNYIHLPVELMAMACFLSALGLMRRARDWGARAAALFVGTFVPPMIVQVIDLMIYNINLLLPNLSSDFFLVLPTGLMFSAGNIAALIYVIYGDAAHVVVPAVIALAVYGGIGICCLYLIRAVFHAGGAIAGLVVSLTAIRSVFASVNAKSLREFLFFLVVLFVAAVLSLVCIRYVHSLWVYTAAIFYQYSNHPVLQPSINAFVASVYEYLDRTGGDVEWARSVVERPVNGCEDSCSELLRLQMGYAAAAAFLPFLLAVMITGGTVRWFKSGVI